MPLFKEVRKPVIKGAATGSGDVSPLRPRYLERSAPCTAHCLNHSQVREWVTTLAQHEAYQRTPVQAFELAWQKIVAVNPLPAAGARVCQHSCEQSCNRKAKDGAVAIHQIERFLGDYAIAHGFRFTKPAGQCREAVAVVGAGPAGLSCAYQLARRGYAVTAFDAAPQAGGMMRYRIPRSIIPGAVLDAEISNITALGVEFRCNCTVGRDLTADELRSKYAAVFFAMGLQKPARIAARRNDGGAVVAGELPPELPSGPFVEPDQFDARVGNSVCPCIAQGRHVAECIDAALRGSPVPVEIAAPVIKPDQMKLDWYPPSPPHAELPPDDPVGLTETEVIEEAKRCMSCGLCMDCETCWMYCTNNCFAKLPKGEHYRIKLELCNGCKKCAEACPCGYIEMS